MGEVYLVHDPRPGRDVAINVLPATFSANGERLVRFDQEAYAEGALNHPNNLQVHDVGAGEWRPLLHPGTPRRRDFAGEAVQPHAVSGYSLQELCGGGPLPKN